MVDSSSSPLRRLRDALARFGEQRPFTRPDGPGRKQRARAELEAALRAFTHEDALWLEFEAREASLADVVPIVEGTYPVQVISPAHWRHEYSHETRGLKAIWTEEMPSTKFVPGPGVDVERVLSLTDDYKRFDAVLAALDAALGIQSAADVVDSASPEARAGADADKAPAAAPLKADAAKATRKVRSQDSPILPWETEAIVLVQAHPDWKDKRIAKAVGRAPSALSRSDLYRRAAAMARAPGEKQMIAGGLTGPVSKQSAESEAIDQGIDADMRQRKMSRNAERA